MIIRPKTVDANAIYTYMESLADALKAPIVNDSIAIPPEKGKSFVKNIFFEDDFCIRYYNLHFFSDTNFDWCFEKDSGQVTFKLVFTLSGDTETSDPKSLSANSTLLYSVDAVKPYIIPANTSVHRIALLFTSNWLNRNFTDANIRLLEMIHSLTSRNRPAIISQMMGLPFYTTVKELAEEMNQEKFPIIHIKMRSLLLLSTFLDQEFYKVPAKEKVPLSVYHETMVAVEKKLKTCLFTNMPSIPDLAQEFNMSSSTLQRHFKEVFGKNIYQYYLEMKMAMGKELLTTKSQSISEVAYSLGYNKINSFSKLFKKYFGVLPKDIKRRKTK